MGSLLKDNIELGGIVGFSEANDMPVFYDDYGIPLIGDSKIDIGPYIKAYWPINEQLFFTGQFAGLYGIGVGKDDYKTLTIGASPGLMYRPASLIGINLQLGFLGYQSESFGNGFDNNVTTLGLDLTNSRVSISFFL